MLFILRIEDSDEPENPNTPKQEKSKETIRRKGTPHVFIILGVLLLALFVAALIWFLLDIQ